MKFTKQIFASLLLAMLIIVSAFPVLANDDITLSLNWGAYSNSLVVGDTVQFDTTIYNYGNPAYLEILMERTDGSFIDVNISGTMYSTRIIPVSYETGITGLPYTTINRFDTIDVGLMRAYFGVQYNFKEMYNELKEQGAGSFSYGWLHNRLKRVKSLMPDNFRELWRS